MLNQLNNYLYIKFFNKKKNIKKKCIKYLYKDLIVNKNINKLIIIKNINFFYYNYWNFFSLEVYLSFNKIITISTLLFINNVKPLFLFPLIFKKSENLINNFLHNLYVSNIEIIIICDLRIKNVLINKLRLLNLPIICITSNLADEKYFDYLIKINNITEIHSFFIAEFFIHTYLYIQKQLKKDLNLNYLNLNYLNFFKINA
jgi:hypothetical protein